MIICAQIHKCYRKLTSSTKQAKPSKTHTLQNKKRNSGKETIQKKIHRKEKSSISSDDTPPNIPAPKHSKLHDRKPTAFVLPTAYMDDESDDESDDGSADVIKNQWHNKGTAVYLANRQNSHNNEASLKYVVFIPTKQKEKANQTPITKLKQIKDNSIITQAPINSMKSQNSEISILKSNHTLVPEEQNFDEKSITTETSEISKNTLDSKRSPVKLNESTKGKVTTQASINSKKTQISERSAVKSNKSKDKETLQTPITSKKSLNSERSAVKPKESTNKEITQASIISKKSQNSAVKSNESKDKETIQTPITSKKFQNSQRSAVTPNESTNKEMTQASILSKKSQNSERSAVKPNEARNNEIAQASINSKKAQNSEKSAVKSNESTDKETTQASKNSKKTQNSESSTVEFNESSTDEETSSSFDESSNVLDTLEDSSHKSKSTNKQKAVHF